MSHQSTEPLISFWDALYNLLAGKVRAQIFKTFFSELSALKLEGNQFIIASKDKRVTNHLNQRYSDLLGKCASEILGKPMHVLVQNNIESATFDVMENKRGKVLNPSSSEHGSIHFHLDYTFDRFVEGSSNQNALLACKGAANQPNDYHSPIFISGGVGLGKTHLLMAVGNYIMNFYSWLKVKYVSAEDFQSNLIDSYRNKSIHKFRENYRDVDIFLFDDIQLITSRAEFTQNELFNTFNYLYQNKKQILISSDRPAQRLAALKDRLISRFQSGLIVDIKPPNFDTRVKIIQTKSKEMGISLDQEVIVYLADRITTQVRLIEAALIKLVFFSQNQAKNFEISLDTLKKALEDMPIDGNQHELKVQNILVAVSDFFQLKPEDIKGRSQKSDIVLARHIGMHLTRNVFPDLSLSYVASIFGRSDHTTVIHAERKIRRMLERDISLQKQIEAIQSQI